jgi:hypothetical protein
MIQKWTLERSHCINMNNFGDTVLWFRNQVNLELKVCRFKIWTRKYLEGNSDSTVSCIKCSAKGMEFHSWNSWLENIVMAVLCVFCSTYSCESLFSVMNSVKPNYMIVLTEEASAACVELKRINCTRDVIYVVCLKSSVNSIRKQTKQKIHTH